MLIGSRIEQRMRETGLSQAELARQVGISQQAIGKLVRGNSRSTSHIARIARALETTAAFLEGETDDPDHDAPPPAPAATVQFITMPVALPSEAALTRMFEALLAASRRLNEAELARELARRLPTALGAARGPLIAPATDQAGEPASLAEAQPSARREPRRAQST